MLQAKWIEPTDAHCPIATPMFFVWKKDGTVIEQDLDNIYML
jgi:hypothetical protein